MTSKEKQDRSTQITIRLEPKIVDGLREIADRLGIKTSTVAGYAIGEFVAKNQAQWANVTAVNKMMVEEMAKQLSAPFAAMFEGKSPEELKELFKDD
jgi:predicted transcriptional regulator